MTVHTYLKYSKHYSVGMWLPNREGVTGFVPMFDVNTLTQALIAVRLLNGGPGQISDLTQSIVLEH